MRLMKSARKLRFSRKGDGLAKSILSGLEAWSEPVRNQKAGALALDGVGAVGAAEGDVLRAWTRLLRGLGRG